MKTWLLVDGPDGEPRDIWEEREMSLEEAFLRAGRTKAAEHGSMVEVWVHREIMVGTYEAAIATREEILELWPEGAISAKKYRGDVYDSRVLGCPHGRLAGVPCPHCMGVS